MTRDTEARLLLEVEGLRADVAAFRAELDALRAEVQATGQLLDQCRERLLLRYPDDVAVIEAAFGTAKGRMH